MDNIKISDMTFDDYKSIYPVYNTEFDEFWSLENLKSELDNPNSKCIVAKLDEKIVGFAGVWFSVDDAHITNIVVHKAFRHKGIGSMLLEELIELAKIKSSLTLEVNTQNETAYKLYSKYGFTNLGIRKKYYKGIDDAYIMTLYF